MCVTDCRHTAPLGTIALLSLTAVSHRAYGLVKRVADVVMSSAVMIICLPLCLVIAAAIKVDSRGPVLFAQDRAGRDRVPFRMYKFRSMSTRAERSRQHLTNGVGGPVFKMLDDPRITRVGRFLRRLSLDELPQFLNVLLGHMSLVGPRPLPMCDVTNCGSLPRGLSREEVDEWLDLRHTVAPGITGLWQVSGRSLLPLRDWIRYDIEYVRTRGTLLDLKILLMTPFAALSGRGAI
jgi:lipopolysaccharide/colanic/teichoic acid biosynthesis glycosyltransferase